MNSKSTQTSRISLNKHLNGITIAKQLLCPREETTETESSHTHPPLLPHVTSTSLLDL